MEQITKTIKKWWEENEIETHVFFDRIRELYSKYPKLTDKINSFICEKSIKLTSYDEVEFEILKFHFATKMNLETYFEAIDFNDFENIKFIYAKFYPEGVYSDSYRKVREIIRENESVQTFFLEKLKDAQSEIISKKVELSKVDVNTILEKLFEIAKTMKKYYNYILSDKRKKRFSIVSY